MFERFTQAARDAVERSTLLARDMGVMTVEAEHLLLGVTTSDTPAAQRLADAGLDEEGLREALRSESVRSLAAVGVTADAPQFAPFIKTPRLGNSAKLALERALRAALARHDRHIGAEHVALGVLMATVGTVPRALECAGVDRAALISSLSA
jgi:ATP-dependent Clp protease ATP-binding subunit ClpA